LITQLVTDLDGLHDIVPAWDVLTRNALEPNVFYESWALLPAFEQFVPAHSTVVVLLVWADTTHAKLMGLFPLVCETAYLGCPVCHWKNWLHLHCPVGIPPIHREYAGKVLDTFYNWLGRATAATLFSFQKVPVDGLFFKHLRTVLASRGQLLDTSDQWERALLSSPLSGADYIAQHQRKKKLKEFERLRRRLGELGQLEFHTLLPGDTRDMHQWAQEFLSLEKKGWKGRSDTAMQSQPHERYFAERLISYAAARGQLMMLKITLDGKPIAIKLNLNSATQGAFALKIAYDEQYAQYSPGVLLELENILVTQDKAEIGWMDSCAVPDHPMINHLWSERRQMANVRISTGHLFSKTFLRVMHSAKSWRKRMARIRLIPPIGGVAADPL